MSEQLLSELKEGMAKALTSLRGDLAKMRTGRASSNLVDGVQVDYYGSPVPVNQVANVTTPDARTIQVAPWEASTLPAIEKAILAANIGLTPQNDGKVIRINVPALTEERRKDMVKVVKKMGEESKIAIRNRRRDGNESVKSQEKAKELSEDDAKRVIEQIQKVTDEKVAEVDQIIVDKEKEIMTV